MHEINITFVIVVLIPVIGFTISVLVGIKTKEILRNQANKNGACMKNEDGTKQF